MSDTIQILATSLFALAVLHTFFIKVFQHLAHKFPEGSVQENLFHLLGEVETVFGLWAAFLVAGIALLANGQEAIQYVESRNFTEPIFVFAIMSVAATRPVLDFAGARANGHKIESELEAFANALQPAALQAAHIYQRD